MGPKIVQHDNLDREPQGSGRTSDHSWSRRQHASIGWRGLGVLCLFLLIIILFVSLRYDRDIRYWIQFGGGGWVPNAVIIAVALFLLKRFLLVEQPGGYKVLWFRADERKVIEGMLRVQHAEAARMFAEARQLTLTGAPAQQQLLEDGIDDIVDGEVLPPDPFELALANVPRLVDLEYIIDSAPGSMSVPLGTDHTGAPRWLDLRKGILHVGIFGGSGAGKDNLLESWFLSLSKNNSPDRVQFAVLDGKGHWMKPILNNLAHMWLPPAGGIGDEGQRALEHTLKAIQAEAARRGKLVFGANCDTMEMYCQKTGESMPYLVVMISDVMGNIVNDVDKLLVDLVSKARALGIRVFVSMQTPTKQNTQWRTNLSTVLAAQMQQPSNDAPALGLVASDMQFPPSRLPDPQSRPGLFSVRNGRDQFLIQAPLVRKPFLSTSIAELPVKAMARPVVSASAVQSGVVSASVEMPNAGAIVYPAYVKTPNGKIAFLLSSGYTYRQIERELSVSHATISQVSRALKKGVTS